jgi:transposase
MATVTCPGCLERDGRLAALERRVAELEALTRDLQARLATNATNSSTPPSANPPGAPKPTAKQPTGNQRGAQPGHPPRLRLRLPPERVRRVVTFVPDACGRCGAGLPRQPGPGDPEPTWHQVAELPELAAEVTEYQGHARTCLCCGAVTHAAIPADLKAHSFGPRLAATLSYLVGCHRVSRRGAEEFADAVFAVPVSLGSVCHLERQTSEALAPAHAEAVQAVRQAPAKHVDETSWKEVGQGRWLWVAATATVAAFVVHLRRGADGLRALLGAVIGGILISDRWVAYKSLPAARRQLCWAHLVRDFTAMVDRGGAGVTIGEDLLCLAGVLFDGWKQVRDGPRTRHWFCRTILAAIRPDVQALLERGAVCGCAKTAATCRELLAWEESLWTFAQAEGVEPTNNHAERVLRKAVLWRKGSFGCGSAEGCRFVERILTVAQTLRLQRRPVLDYLYRAVVAHRAGLPTPKLLPAD